MFCLTLNIGNKFHYLRGMYRFIIEKSIQIALQWGQKKILPSVASVGRIEAKLVRAALVIIGSVAKGARKASMLSRLKVLGAGVLKP